VTTIDFSSAPGSFTSYTQFGGTVTAVGGTTISLTTAPGGSAGILADGATRPEFRVDFATLSQFVSVDLGDYNADADLLFLEAFSASNVSLGFTSLATLASDTAMHTLTVNTGGIAYAIFGGRPPSIGGSSVYADNISFDLAAAPTGVPEPSTWAMMLVGFAAIGAGLRRRQNTSVRFDFA
jgi:hypothetical protein